MRACIFISRRIFPILTLTILLCLAWTPLSFAQGVPLAEGAQQEPAVPKKDETGLFDGTSPFLEYGDFNMNEEENEDTQFFQYGRFFGLSLGIGYQSATGNRGKLYTAALPRFDARIQYWFGFHLAGDLGVFFANHSFTTGSVNYEAKLIGY